MKKSSLWYYLVLVLVLTFNFQLSTFNCQAAEKGLVAYWSFDKVDGEQVSDLSGNGFDGTVLDAEEVKGVSGNALSFKGGAVEVQGNEALTPTDQFTVELWFWTDVPGQNDKYMINNIFGEATYGYRLGLAGGSIVWQVPVTSWSHSIATNGYIVPMGQWVFVAGTFDGKKMHIFVNGEEKAVGDRPGAANPSPDSLYIGTFTKGHERAFFEGIVDEVKIYNRALTQQELMEQYKKIAPPASQLKVESSKLKVEKKEEKKEQRKSVSKKELVGYWKFDEGAGEEAKDSSGRGNDGAVAGAEWVNGKSGKAISVSGEQFVEIPSSEDLQLGAEISIEAWVFPTDINGWRMIVVKEKEYQLRVNPPEEGNPFSIFVFLDGSWEPRTANIVPQVERWSHVLAVWDGAKLQMWVNGEMKEAERKGSSSPGEAPVHIGQGFIGIIDEVKIYNYALGNTEIVELFKKDGVPIAEDKSKVKVQNVKGKSEKKEEKKEQRESVSNKGLVGYWKFDEGSGESAGDASGNGHDGEVMNGEWAKGISGSALAFNAENKTCVIIPDADDLNPTAQISVEVWIKGDVPQGDKQIVNKVAGGKEGYRLTCGGDNIIAWQIPTEEKEWSGGMGSATGYNFGEWSYIAGTYDGKTMRVYINGKEAGSMPRTGEIFQSQRDLIIGDFAPGAGTPAFTGLMDELRIYSRALTPQEIEERYKSAAPPASQLKVESSKLKVEKKEEKPVIEAKPGTLVEWNFNKEGDLEGWSANGHMSDVEVSGGMLKFKTVDWDPFLTGSGFEFPANSMQFIEIRMKASSDGGDEFFWSNTFETQYGGFTPGKETPFSVIGDKEFHIYRIFPAWKDEKKIILMRFDSHDKCEYEVDYIKIVQIAPGKNTKADFDFTKDTGDWQISEGIDKLTLKDGILSFKTVSASPLLMNQSLNVATKGNGYLAIRMAVDKGTNGSMFYVTSTGSDRISIPLKADGKMHLYNIPMAAQKWTGSLYLMNFTPTDAKDASVQVDYIKVCPEVPQAAEMELKYIGLTGAVNRAGINGKVIALVNNRGGFVKNVEAKIALPKGIQLLDSGPAQKISGLEFNDEEKFEWKVRADSPIKDTVSVSVKGAGVPEIKGDAVIEFLPSLNLPKADYVPAPQAVKTDYQVGVYYFPGWKPGVHYGWQKIMPYPEREPVLGWYREGEPEVADWHVKWCVEHGVTFFIYDWYWSRGSRSLEHALDGLFKSKYGNQLKFCLLWANHNPKGTSSEKDLRNVTKFWIDNYFKRDNYLKVDNKPVMVIFSPWRFREDMGSEKVNAAFDKMRDLCKENGFNGLYMVACSGGYNEGEVTNLVNEGYDAVSAYNWVFGMMPYEENTKRFAESWAGYMGDDRIKFIVPVCGGWDARPWHGPATTVLSGRTPQNFKKHLQDAKDLLDKSERSPKLKMVFIEAWNEFGEGSYIEPHKEYGFGYLDAIRDVFTKAPKEHIDVAPVNVGLGPYDSPGPQKARDGIVWEFNTADDGWGGMMGLADVRIESGCLKGLSVDNDPAFNGPPMETAAKKYPFMILSAKASKDAKSQIFWATKQTPDMNEPASIQFDIPGDNKFHEIKLNVRENELWAGTIIGLRFDPCSEPDVSIEVDYIKLSEK